MYSTRTRSHVRTESGWVGHCKCPAAHGVALVRAGGGDQRTPGSEGGGCACQAQGLDFSSRPCSTMKRFKQERNRSPTTGAPKEKRTQDCDRQTVLGVARYWLMETAPKKACSRGKPGALKSMGLGLNFSSTVLFMQSLIRSALRCLLSTHYVFQLLGIRHQHKHEALALAGGQIQVVMRAVERSKAGKMTQMERGTLF